MLRLTTLGAVDLRDRLGHPVREVLAQPKRLALLVYLAIESQRGPVSRDRVLASFWPESDTARARNTLAQSLHHLRQALGADVLESHGVTAIGIRHERLWCDATVFVEAFDKGEFELALDLYHGEFCPALFVGGAPELDQWLDTQRRRLRGQALSASRAMAERLLSRGELEAAARAARRALALRPDTEADVRAMLVLLEHCGDAAGALAAYREFADRLTRDLDLEPAAETRQLVEGIRGRREQATAAAIAAPSPGERPAAPDAGPPVHPGRARRLLVRAGLAAALAGILWSAWQQAHRPPPPDPQLVVVAPWSVASADTSLGYLVEGFADLVAGRLEVPGHIRTTDLRTVVAAWRRAGRPINERDAMREALKLGAGRLVTGSLVGTPRSLIITAMIASTDGATRIVVTASGSPDSLAALADTIARGLLLVEFGETTARGDGLSRVPLAALRSYLLGRAAYRAGRYASAVELFRSALSADSSFALAALGAVAAADFLSSGSDLALSAAAWRLRDRLGAADRTLLEALSGPPARLSRLQRLEQLERFSRLAAERADAWYWLGDALFHDGSYLGRDSGFVRAEAALRRSVALDSAFLAPLAHLVQVAAAQDDRRAVQRLGALYFARDTTSEVAHFLRWRVAVALGDSAAVRRIEADTQALPVETLRLIAEWSAIEGLSGPTSLRMAESYYRRARRGEADVVYAERVVLAAAIAAGKFERFTPLMLDQRHRNGLRDDAAWPLSIGLWLDGPTAPLDSLLARTRLPGDARRRAELLSWQLIWALRTHAPDTMVSRLLAAYDASSGERRADDVTPLMIAASLRRTDLPRQLARFDSMRDAVPQVGSGYPQIEAVALLAAGDAAGAANRAARVPFVTGGDYSATPLLRLRGLARERSGDTAGAIRAYRRYLNLRSDPDPGARPYADSVRVALARLEHVRPSP